MQFEIVKTIREKTLRKERPVFPNMALGIHTVYGVYTTYPAHCFFFSICSLQYRIQAGICKINSVILTSNQMMLTVSTRHRPSTAYNGRCWFPLSPYMYTVHSSHMPVEDDRRLLFSFILFFFFFSSFPRRLFFSFLIFPPTAKSILPFPCSAQNSGQCRKLSIKRVRFHALRSPRPC